MPTTFLTERTPNRIKNVLRGVDDTLRALRLLEGKVGFRVLKKAVNASTTPVARAVRQLVPRRTGALKAGIAKKVWQEPFSKRLVGVVGARNFRRGTDKQQARWGEKYGRANPINYFHLVDAGARPHDIEPRRNKEGEVIFRRADGTPVARLKFRHPGAPAQNIIARALVQSQRAAVDAFNKKATAEIAAEYRKARVTR